MIEINLLPVREAKKKAEVQQQLLLMGVTLLGAIGVATAVEWNVRQRITEAASHATQLENQINQFKPQLAQVEAYRKTRQEIEQKLDVIESLERARSGPVRILDELATHTPERLWLTQLETNGAEITFQGMSLDNDFVALFLTALNESAYFANVELESTELKEEDGLKLNSFTVNAQLRRSDEDKSQAAGLPASAGR